MPKAKSTDNNFNFTELLRKREEDKKALKNTRSTKMKNYNACCSDCSRKNGGSKSEKLKNFHACCKNKGCSLKKVEEKANKEEIITLSQVANALNNVLNKVEGVVEKKAKRAYKYKSDETKSSGITKRREARKAKKQPQNM